MAQYGKIRCPICYASIESNELVVNCPACKERIIERLQSKGEGLTTATSEGPKMKRIKDVTKEVY